MGKKRKSFVFYVDWIPIIRILDKDETDHLFEAIDMVVKGEAAADEIGFESPNLSNVWDFLKEKLVDNLEHYEEVKARRIENLRKASEKRQLANAPQMRTKCEPNASHLHTKCNANASQMHPICTANASQMESVTVTDTVTDTVTVTGLSTNVDNIPNGNLRVIGGCKGEQAPQRSPSGSRFLPPTTEEVREYVEEKNLSDYVDPDDFVDFYASKGWQVGKSSMRDWKAAVRGWASRSRKEHKNEEDSFLTLTWED